MIRILGRMPDGRSFAVLGLLPENVSRLTAGDPVRFDVGETADMQQPPLPGITGSAVPPRQVDVVWIAYAATEAALVAALVEAAILPREALDLLAAAPRPPRRPVRDVHLPEGD